MDELWDRVVDGIDLSAVAGGGGEEQALAALAMDAVGRAGRDAARQRLLEAAGSFGSDSNNNNDDGSSNNNNDNNSQESPSVQPQELFQMATDNASYYQPKWISHSHMTGRTSTGNGIEVGEGERQQVAHLPLGAGEGRTVRASEAVPRTVALSALTASTRSQARSFRRTFGFRVAFDHPSRETTGGGLGGCYLVGVTTGSFNNYNERNGLQQSPHFWGIEDSGRKYEGTRHTGVGSRSSSASRRGAANYGTEVAIDEAPRNLSNVLFGAKEVVTVAVDMDSRTLTFWRDNQLLGTLVSNLPRGGSLYPVAVPFTSGATVAITDMNGDPLQLLRNFSTGSIQDRLQHDDELRRKLVVQRMVLIKNGEPTAELVDVLRTIVSWYSGAHGTGKPGTILNLSYVEAARLWYRCGIKLSCVDSLFSDHSTQQTNVAFDHFLEVVRQVILDDENFASSTDPSTGKVFEVGDRVELVDGYQKYGDAAGGPLQPGARGKVVELQHGSNGECQSIRVLDGGRRWWYQPQAIRSERSRLIETPAVWFLHKILRSHGFDHLTLQPIVGKPVTCRSWEFGDIVVPKKIPPPLEGEEILMPMDSLVGRIIPETSRSASAAAAVSSIGVRGKASTAVLVEFVHEKFGDMTGASVSNEKREGPFVRWIKMNKLVHSSVCHGVSVLDRGSKGSQSACWPIPAAALDESMLPDLSLSVVNEQLKSDIADLAKLDRSAIEAVSKACKKKSKLAFAFSAGLPEAIVSAIDCASGRMKRPDSAYLLAQSVSALGSLSVNIIEQLFSSSENGGADMGESLGADDADSGSMSGDDAMDETGSNGPSRIPGENNLNGWPEAFAAHHAENNGGMSALQQRRSMILSLMSRARHANAGSLDDLLGHEAGRLGEYSLRQLVDGLGPIGQSNARSFLFGAGPDALQYGSFDELIVSPERANLSHNRSSLGTHDSPATAPSSILSSILQGSGDSKLAGSSLTDSAILSGILCNSLPWVRAAVELQRRKLSFKPPKPLRKIGFDSDGVPTLLLALSLGCSEEIIKILLDTGGHVGSKELRIAAYTGTNLRVLSVLLQNTLYSDGIVDLRRCTPAVVGVIERAINHQKQLNQSMLQKAGEFLVVLLRKLVQLGLTSRQKRSAELATFSQAISDVLSGHVLLRAMRRAQQQGTPRARQLSTPIFASPGTQVEISDRPLSPSVGLIGVIPESILAEALLSDTPHMTNFLLLIEDHLCSKSVGDGVIGLSLLLTLLQKFQGLCACSEIERFGFMELVSFHDAIASRRIAEILSSQVSGTRNYPSLLPDQILTSPSAIAASAVQCPKKHVATLFVTKHSSFRCDLCGRGVERGCFMHGCRECDWDACETCTDKSHGGLVKSSYLKLLASDCQRLLARDSSNYGDQDGVGGMDSFIKRLSLLDNNSELNNLSVRLLQREAVALKELAAMLEEPGRITVHQFLSIILPSLHASLVGEPSPDKRMCRGSSVHKSKKPRFLDGSCRSDGSAETFLDGRSAFCSDAVNYLLKSGQETADFSKWTSEDAASSVDAPEARDASFGHYAEDDDDDDGEADDDSDASRPGSANSKDLTGTKGGSPELLVRLHQILSLYETVSLVSKSNEATGKSSDGALKSLIEPIEIHLSPSAFERQTNSLYTRSLSMHVRAEPLIEVKDLELHVLRSSKISHLPYVSFCRRLASDNAIIVETSAQHRTILPERQWRLGRIVSYDEATGSHAIQYASNWQGRSPFNAVEIRYDNRSVFGSLEFDSQEKHLILAARKYYILCRRGPVLEGTVNNPALSNFALPLDSLELNAFAQSVGTRVESDCGSSAGTWMAYTIIARESDHSDAGKRKEERFVLVSDSGEVFRGVASTQIRFTTESSSGLDTRRSQYMLVSEVPEGKQGSRVGLKRQWSALSLVESMQPIMLSAIGDQGMSTDDFSSASNGRILLNCSVGGSEICVAINNTAIESPPSLHVEFSLHDTLPTLSIPSKSLPLVGALRQLYRRGDAIRDQPHNLRSGSHTLFYSVKCDLENESFRVLPIALASQWDSIQAATKRNKDSALSPVANHLLAQSISQGRVNPTSAGETNQFPASNENHLQALNFMALLSEGRKYRGLCDGLGEICVQCMEVIGLLADYSASPNVSGDKTDIATSPFENANLSQKLAEVVDDPLVVVGGALPEWCMIAPIFAPRIFSYDTRRLLLDRAAFGVSRSTLKQQESKVKVGRLRQRMAALRSRAVELVGEAFSGGAEDPTALQLQADELYGMEEALAARVKAAFRSEHWVEMSLEVAKAAVKRETLLLDAATVMQRYANDEKVRRRRLEVRFENESGFDAASGDEAGVTRGFYADVAEALLSSEHVAGVFCPTICPNMSGIASLDENRFNGTTSHGGSGKLAMWIPDMDATGQRVIPTPRVDPRSAVGVFPRPLCMGHPDFEDVLIRFRFTGRLFAAAVRDGFMFPLPLSSAFLKLVQHVNNSSPCDPDDTFGVETVLSVADLPRPGFLGGEVYAVDSHICSALDRIDEADPPLSRYEMDKAYRAVASDKNFARVALNKSYDCSFDDYFQEGGRTFVDPLDPTQGEDAAPLCPDGHRKHVTIYNVREWVALAKRFILHDGVFAQALAFRRGVEDFFPADYLRLFTPEELQRDVCGVGDNVDSWNEEDIRRLLKLDGGKGAAEALVAVAAIGGEGGAALSRRFGPSSPTINFLVKALKEAAPQQRRQFLSFVTSLPIATPGKIEVVPIVSPSGEFLPMRDPGCLPRANTCARRLYLPKFETYESFSQVIWAVVREESKFKGFYEWRGS